MEGEVSGIAKLGIVLIALAVLIGLGFGIFQISKGTANTGVTNVQKELDGVSTSQFTTYDQTTITGQMVRSAVQDFEGEQVAVLIASQAWVNLINEAGMVSSGEVTGHASAASAGIAKNGSGFSQYTSNNADIPVVVAYATDPSTGSTVTTWTDASTYKMKSSKQNATTMYGAFINYNAILGNKEKATGVNEKQTYKYDGTNSGYMAYVFFDTNCFRCTSGFMTDAGGKVQYSNITKNLMQTGTTEFIPTGAKFAAYLIKDTSGTIQGITCQQVAQG